MIIRGSLKRCINSAQITWQRGEDDMLSIIHCPKGKYYFLLNEEMLLDYNMRPKSDDMRLIFRGTAREMQQFAKEQTRDLFERTEDGKTS